MLSLIFLIILALSFGGIVFLVAHKIPILAAYSSATIEGEEPLTPEAILAQEKIKLLVRRFLIFAAQKAVFLLHWLEKIVQKVSEKTRRFYHRQKRREDAQEDIVKKQEEIAKNSDYWHVIKHGLRGRKKKKEKPAE